MGSLPSSDGSDARGYDTYGIRPHMMMMDNMPAAQLLLERFGWSRNRDGQNAREWEGRFWYGTATKRLTIKSEGEAENANGGSSGRVEALWSHAITPFWDLQLGARRDFGTGPKRNWAAFGIEGMLPYRIELEATGYVGPSGRTALGLKAEYDLLLTQRLVFTPELEASLYGKSDPERGIGSGLSSVPCRCGCATRSRASSRRMLAYPSNGNSARPPTMHPRPAPAVRKPRSWPAYGSGSRGDEPRSARAPPGACLRTGKAGSAASR